MLIHSFIKHILIEIRIIQVVSITFHEVGADKSDMTQTNITPVINNRRTKTDCNNIFVNFASKLKKLLLILIMIS